VLVRGADLLYEQAMPPRRDPLQEQLRALAELREQPLPRREEPAYAVRQGLLRGALTARSSFAVAAAAELVHASDSELLALLPQAFDRFLGSADQSDKGCAAKTAIARALERVESDEESVFRRGLLHVQKEPVFGGRQDTAVELRGICALGLARISPPGVLSLLAELLADPEHGARTAAARALGCTGQDGAVPLLRYKALLGDDEPLVLAECLTSLLCIEQAAAVPFVRRFLDPDDEQRADAAALALGQSRLPEAVPLLKEYAEAPPLLSRKAALVGLAMLRRTEATDYLLELVREAEIGQAVMAVEALGMFRHDRTLQRQVSEAVSPRRSVLLGQALARSFVAPA
jgi:HEAT repeat protein